MRKWLQELVDKQYLPAIAALQDTPEGRAAAQTWADWMKQQWANHGLKALKQQRNLMTDVRNAIKHQLGEEHFALESMNFTVDEWIQINQPIDDQVANRNEHQTLLDPKAVNALVTRAVKLLASREWADIAAGLAVLTGRRSAEILATAQFEYKTPYSVTFTGALKRKGETQQLSFEIPTLAQAEYIINALNKLRQIVDTEGMDNTDINQKYSDAVARACDRHFADLVPKREGRDNLYTHLFRSVYAAIATHWYCPPRVADIEFKAAIQGHFTVLDQANPEKRRSLAANRHYSDYKMGNGEGNIDGRQGIKLGQPGIEVIEMFKDKPTQNGKTAQSTDSMAKRARSLLHIFADERDRWLSVLDQLEPQEIHQPEKTSVLLTWIEQQLKAAQSPPEADQLSVEAVSAPPEPPATALPVIDNLASGIAFLTTELQAAKAQNTELERQRDQSKAEAAGYQQQVSQLQQVNAQLQAELAQFHQAQVQLEPLLKLLQGAHAQPAPTAPTLSQLIAQPAAPTAISTPPTTIPAPSPTSPQAAAQAISAPAAIATKPTVPKHPRRSGGTEAKVNRIIDAILAYNNTPGLTHTDKWAISFPVVKELGKPIGATYQKVIQQVFQARQAELEAHHQRHGLGSRHNRGKDLSQLTQLIRIEDTAASA